MLLALPPGLQPEDVVEAGVVTRAAVLVKHLVALHEANSPRGPVAPIEIADTDCDALFVVSPESDGAWRLRLRRGGP